MQIITVQFPYLQMLNTNLESFQIGFIDYYIKIQYI